MEKTRTPGTGADDDMRWADRVSEVFEAIRASGRDEVFITLRPEDEVDADYRVSVAAGGPLAGQIMAVKDNIDVAGMPTTAGCPGFSYTPEEDAECVARLRAAGAVVLGKTNLDQFATGLVGVRSPYGAVRSAKRESHISGGSSSGSAVAVALGFCDFALGTDTAGSGRIPAALNGIVGVKPTVGVVSTRGVVPACRSYDCVTVFARNLARATSVRALMAGGEGTRQWPSDAPLAPRFRTTPVVAVPEVLFNMDAGWTDAFHRSVEQLAESGVDIVPVDFTPFLDAARLLYDGGLVAERYEAVGDFLDSVSDDARAGVDPTVQGIIRRAADISASELIRDRHAVDVLRATAMRSLRSVGATALMVPTAPLHPTIEDVKNDPVATNSRMGTYTNFCNLFDLCAVAVPAGIAVGEDDEVSDFGVTILAEPFGDAIAADLAARFEPGPPASNDARVVSTGAPEIDLAVFGEHRRGGALTHQLTALGARWTRTIHTAPGYRMFRIPGEVPKPGIVRDSERGLSLRGEVWALSPAALGTFLGQLPPPMNLGAVELDDGSSVVGFGCDPTATEGTEELTERREWPLGQPR